MAFLGLGAGMIISSLTTKYRDLTFLVTFGVQLLMYASPVIYPLSSLPEKYKWFILANPMSSIIEIFRLALLGQGIFNIYYFSYTAIFSLGIFIIGAFVFNKVQKSFMDTV
jgi:lipopolysaccharide transport system permease protein